MPLPGYMKITGESQGPLEGETGLVDREGFIEVLACDHAIKVPTNEFGMTAGGRMHMPLSITKTIDRCSPMLQQALCTNELLPEVILDWYRTDGVGMDELYYRIKLTNAQIISISFNVQNVEKMDDQSQGHAETVTFVYDQIIWSHELDGVEYEDVWTTA